MSATVRFGTVVSTAVGAATVTLDGVDVNLVALNGLVVRAGEVATVVHDGRRMVVVGATVPPVATPTILSINGVGPGPANDPLSWTPAEVNDPTDATWVTSYYSTELRSPNIYVLLGVTAWPDVPAGSWSFTFHARIVGDATHTYRVVSGDGTEGWTGTLTSSGFTTITGTVAVTAGIDASTLILEQGILGSPFPTAIDVSYVAATFTPA